MKFTLLTSLTLVVVTICLSSGALIDAKELPRRNSKPELARDNFDVSSDDLSNVDSDDNDLLLNYDPIEPKRTDYYTSARNANNKIKVGSYTNLERETVASINNNNKKPAAPAVREVMSADTSNDQESVYVNRAKDIALNSREIRLVGPNQKEVEMKDDLPTKFVVAIENLGKEATDVWGTVNEKLDKGWTDLKRSEVWGQVNEKLDKGWTDLKTMVEGVVAPSSKQQSGIKQN